LFAGALTDHDSSQRALFHCIGPSVLTIQQPIEAKKAMSSIAIIGATGTIGSVLARRLVRLGHTVLLVGRNDDKLRSLSEEVGQPFVTVDMISSQPLEAALRAAADTQGGFHALVNCIGSILLKPAHTTTDDDFRQVVETNLYTAFATVRVGAKLLRERGGTIILFASAAAEIGIQNHEAIAAAKSGVIGLARSAAATYASNNIRVNVVSPGLVRTEMTRRIWENSASANASAQLHALGRLGEPEHVASLVSWLLESENDWITGQVIGIDGGLGHVLPRR
jgi:NAD(P)-dependent dehydrogenase (short-subunit alcohol dehydrogenase family)